jgi:hypothetical protein
MMHVPSRVLFPAAALLGALLPAAAGAQAAPRQYTLFQGANISVVLAKNLYPVRDVNGSDWVVDISGKDTVVSGKDAPVNLKIVPVLKLTEQAADIEGFKKEAAYTFANDPSVRLTRGMAQAADVNAGAQAVANQASAVNAAAVNVSSPTSHATGDAESVMQTASANVQQKVESASAEAAASVALGGTQDSTGGHDAMDIEFLVSSPRPLQDPYLVTMTKFHPRGSDPGVVQSLVFAKALEPIGSKPSKIHFTEEGFPIDYQVTEFQLHLYNHGIEVATNVSQKRQEMTPEQAFDYVRKAYLESHKSATLHAMPVMGELPADLHEQLAQGKYAGTIYVKVSKDGTADEAFSDAACSQRIDDPYLDSVVKTVRFKPALDKGEPVEGIASLNLSQLRI